MIHDRIKPHDGSNEYCQNCEQQIDHCICSTPEEEQNNLPECQSLNKTDGPGGNPDSPLNDPGIPQLGASRLDGADKGLANTLSDEWEQIAAQLDYWRDMDMQYWEQRKEREYAAWLDRRIKSRIQKALFNEWENDNSSKVEHKGAK